MPVPVVSLSFATAQSGGGAGECAETGPDNRDDLFGCGTMWMCPVSEQEVTTVTKTDPYIGGGVLCCRDAI